MGRARSIPTDIVKAARTEARGKPKGIILALSKKYGHQLFRAIRGHTYKDLDVPPVLEDAPSISAFQLEEARRLRRTGMTFQQIAAQLGVTRPTLQKYLAQAYLDEPSKVTADGATGS